VHVCFAKTVPLYVEITYRVLTWYCLLIKINLHFKIKIKTSKMSFFTAIISYSLKYIYLRVYLLMLDLVALYCFVTAWLFRVLFTQIIYVCRRNVITCMPYMLQWLVDFSTLLRWSRCCYVCVCTVKWQVKLSLWTVHRFTAYGLWSPPPDTGPADHNPWCSFIRVYLLAWWGLSCDLFSLPSPPFVFSCDTLNYGSLSLYLFGSRRKRTFGPHTKIRFGWTWV
jgi:hypothetical protein